MGGGGEQISRESFGNDFHWGVSTSAYQIEGAFDADGKGPSIWDYFTSQKGNIWKNHHGRDACNFYELYLADLALMKLLQIPNFRFSLSWPRILPSGKGHVNYKGLDFYDRLMDACLERNIEPWVTLYHWDLPQELEKKGGWTNREIVGWFSEYANICLRRFSDRVKYWMVLNEPMVFTGAGYFMGLHAPGRRGLSNFIPAVHHAALCQAEGGRIIHSYGKDLQAGTAFSCSHVDSFSDKERDREAAKRIEDRKSVV